MIPSSLYYQELVAYFRPIRALDDADADADTDDRDRDAEAETDTESARATNYFAPTPDAA